MTQPYEAIDIRLPQTTVTVPYGTQSPHCLCLDDRHHWQVAA